jgi:hypothetical protein
MAASFEVLEFTIGPHQRRLSRLQMRVTAPAGAVMQGLLEELLTFGCRLAGEIDAVLQRAPIGRLRAGRLLLDQQPSHLGAARRAVDRGRAAAHGCRGS